MLMLLQALTKSIFTCTHKIFSRLNLKKNGGTMICYEPSYAIEMIARLLSHVLATLFIKPAYA